MNAQWSYGVFVGVKRQSGELYIANEQDKKIRMARTARRMPDEQRWQEEQLDWVQFVPWNLGREDKDADGDVPEFDFKSGPGARMTEDEMEQIAIMGKPDRGPHPAHLCKTDFEKFGYTDRCPGCSTLLRGMRQQPHSVTCRRRMQERLEGDVRLQNAKDRLADRQRQVQQQGSKKMNLLSEIEDKAMVETDPVKLDVLYKHYVDEYTAESKKRSLLDGIEEKAMTETDPIKLEALYKQYKDEYTMKRAKVDNEDADMETSGETSNEALHSAGASSSQQTGGKKRSSDMPLEELEASINEIINELDGMQDGLNLDVKQIFEEFDQTYAWDDANNMELPLDLVTSAREEEMAHMKGKIFKVVKKTESWAKTGKAPKSTKWVDTDKSHGEGEMLVRSRWVARDFKTRGEKDREDLFCATPPLELLRFLVSRAATRAKSGRKRKMLFIDVKKAHLIPKCQEDVYVELPAEANCREDECGKLIYWLYGCRRAGQAWEDHYSGILVAAGFIRGVASPVVFFHPQRELWCVVHGDDFTFAGYDEDLDFVTEVLKKEYELKVRGRLGPDEKDIKRIDILGRILEYRSWGLSWRADPRHRKMVLEHFGFIPETKHLTTTGNKNADKFEGEQGQVELDKAEATNFRAIVARTNYMAADCPNVQYPTKEVCRDMARPTLASQQKMKKLARYLLSWEEVTFEYKWQDEDVENMRVFTDSDWAGCIKTRRSTSGGLIMLGSHCLKTWSSTQPTVAMSSAEAEYYAMVEGSTRGIGLQTLLKEMGVKIGILVLSTDSSAAKSFASRRGLGKLRHIEVKELWLQEAVCRGRITLRKIEGSKNPADIFTKYLSNDEIVRHLKSINVNLKLRQS